MDFRPDPSTALAASDSACDFAQPGAGARADKRHALAALAVAAGLAGLALPAAHAQDTPANTAAPMVSRATVADDNLWNITRDLVGPAGVSRQQMMVAIQRRNPDAFEAGNMHRLRRGVSLALPTAAEAALEDRTMAIRLVAQHRAALSPGVASAALPARRDAAAAAPPAAAATAAQQSAQQSAQQPEARPPTASAAMPTPAPAASAQSSASSAQAASASAPPETSTANSGQTTISPPAAPDRRPWPWWPVLLVAALAAGALWTWRRPGRAATGDDNEAQSSTFLDDEGVPRKRRPKLLEVSDAAAAMARAVETLQPTVQMVSHPGDPAPLGDARSASAADQEEAALRSDIARARAELGLLA